MLWPGVLALRSDCGRIAVGVLMLQIFRIIHVFCGKNEQGELCRTVAK